MGLRIFQSPSHFAVQSITTPIGNFQAGIFLFGCLVRFSFFVFVLWLGKKPICVANRPQILDFVASVSPESRSTGAHHHSHPETSLININKRNGCTVKFQSVRGQRARIIIYECVHASVYTYIHVYSSTHTQSSQELWELPCKPTWVSPQDRLSRCICIYNRLS